MAGRKQKFSMIHILIMVAAFIWLPNLIEQMAGIPTNPDTPTVESRDDQQSTDPLDVQSASDTQSTDPQETKLETITPAPAVLKLQDTLLSGSGKTAIINGRAFAEQEMLTSLGYPFRVRSILAGRVILEGDGRLYELRRPGIW